MKTVIFSLFLVFTTAFAQPVINHVPLLDKFLWPDTVSAGVYSASGIDSVWVRWYRNNTGTGIRQFKLLFTSGITYRAAFNSTLSELQYGDSIFYKIFAQDASSYHRKDSTIQYKFRHIYSYNICIGSGTDSVSYPFYTFYMDARTDMLFTKNEIIVAGGMSGGINKIGFYIRTASPQVMNNFNIKMQNTSMASLTGFVSSGWTTVYTGTYTVPSSGWQFIQLQQYFFWNNSNNLLVEICFDNNSYTLASKVCAANVPGMTWENHIDNSSGCVLTGGAVQQLRPDIVLQMSPSVGMINNGIPLQFSLSQNYPNPFNPTTIINYQLPMSNYIKLIVYDVMGREVAVLVNETKQPGSYEASFDASQISSGVYFYRLTADGNIIDTKKLVVLK
jgi:hypothetical protein